MCDDDWVNLAMADDSIVADMLRRLHHPPPPPYLNLRWAVRHPRSRSIPKQATKPVSTRASPTTPLSWNGATSASCGGAADSYDESNRINKLLVETSRSKVSNPRETVTAKKSRKKKTLAELKEEESRLLTERRNLKNELASLRLTVEEQRATNESLKRMKLDLESRQNSNTATASEAASGKIISNTFRFVEEECHPSNSISPKTVTHKVLADNSHVHASSKEQEEIVVNHHESPFVLPDLNLPVEEDLSSNAVH